MAAYPFVIFFAGVFVGVMLVAAVVACMTYYDFPQFDK